MREKYVNYLTSIKHIEISPWRYANSIYIYDLRSYTCYSSTVSHEFVRLLKETWQNGR
jgi:hypothetical protein